MRFGLPLFYRSCPTVFATRMIGVVGNFQSKNVLVQPCCTKGLALPRCLSHRGGALHLAINANVLETVADIDGVSDNEKTCLRLLRCKLNKALLVSRALLVKIKRDIENQIRGLLKNLGLIIGQAKMNVFSVRAAELAEARPELAAAVEPLLKAREAVGQQIADLDRKAMRLARNDAQVRRFMTAPGVGSITALCFLATIDDPTRFRRSRSVGAYVGLTTRRFASGEIDWTGRISKCGDKMLRSYLYEAANVLLTRVAKWSALKVLGSQGCEAQRATQSQGCRGSKACRHSAPDVDRWQRIQLVIKGGCQSNLHSRTTRIPPISGN